MTKNKRKEGDWHRSVGAYWGAIYLKGKWRSFKCYYCLQNMGLMKRHVQATIWSQKAANRRPADIPHIKELHTLKKIK